MPHNADIDSKTQRRMIEFLNKAKKPADLTDKVQSDRMSPEKVIQQRDQFGPFGIRSLEELIHVIGPDVLQDWLVHFSNSVYGNWEELYETPEEPPVHAALLNNGNVLLIPHGHFTHVPDTFLWNPSIANAADAFFYPDNQPDDNLYCSGHSFLSNGQLLVAGGGGASPANVNRAWRFNPAGGTNGTWIQTAGDMSYARWYPTVITLGGRRIMVAAGSPNHGKVEIYNEHSDSFHTVTMPSERSFPQTYPGMHLLPGNVIFYTRTGFGNAGPGANPGDPSPGTPYFRFTSPSAGEWVNIADSMESPNRVKGMSAPLFLGPLGGSYITKVLVVGGNGDDTAEIAGLSTVSPTWESKTTIPGGGRSNINLVLLPDNTAFVCGGATLGNSPVLPCALYDPLSNTWSAMDSLAYRRAYHSVALLLPSGQVMITGDVNKIIEIYNPPYLFRGARPDITCYPDIVHHGKMFDIETTQSDDIDKVVMVRPMAVTHQTDTEQRVIGLTFTRSGETLHVRAPNGNHPHPVAPRGYYMLFAINSNGVPSTGKFVLLH